MKGNYEKKIMTLTRRKLIWNTYSKPKFKIKNKKSTNKGVGKASSEV
jgi:hypothetical protein